ncbi:hypothetical protein ACVWZA_003506 [Sphingomonas sp. UYAg733]
MRDAVGAPWLATGFRCRTGFAEMLAALRRDAPLPVAHDPAYISPKE